LRFTTGYEDDNCATGSAPASGLTPVVMDLTL
jgi:hypothetical protein